MVTHYRRVSAGCAVLVGRVLSSLPLSLQQVSNAWYLEVVWMVFAVPGLDCLAEMDQQPKKKKIKRPSDYYFFGRKADFSLLSHLKFLSSGNEQSICGSLHKEQ